MRIGLIGYGAVAGVHAKGLRHWGADLRVVCGPDQAKANAFAASHGIRAVTDAGAMLAECDAAIVASPSGHHFAQAMAVLRAGCHCLVELPPCASAREALELGAAATASRVTLQCAHTTRYLPAIVRLSRWIGEQALGEIQQVLSIRAIPPRSRSWIDDAVLHHAAHHVDLLLTWFGSLEPLACAALPQVEQAQDAILAARLPHGAPVSISVSYTSRLRETRLTVIGSRHTVTTDGFSYIESDRPEFAWRGDEQESYEAAVEAQDRAFMQAAGGEAPVPWRDTVRLAECLDRFSASSHTRRN
jgi:predicted dehydrogenase